MLRDIGLSHLDPGSLIYFCDSAFGDCDGGKSTGCIIGFYRGSPIDFSSFVPDPVAMSSAEAEVNTLTIGIMSAMHVKMIHQEVTHGDSSRPLTIPFLMDSVAAMLITKNDRGTQRTRHIERRYLYCRHAYTRADISLHFVEGKRYQIADIGTKNLTSSEYAYKLSIVESPLPK
jgi:hypothetical protein